MHNRKGWKRLIEDTKTQTITPCKNLKQKIQWGDLPQKKIVSEEPKKLSDHNFTRKQGICKSYVHSRHST